MGIISSQKNLRSSKLPRTSKALASESTANVARAPIKSSSRAFTNLPLSTSVKRGQKETPPANVNQALLSQAASLPLSAPTNLAIPLQSEDFIIKTLPAPLHRRDTHGKINELIGDAMAPIAIVVFLMGFLSLAIIVASALGLLGGTSEQPATLPPMVTSGNSDTQLSQPELKPVQSNAAMRVRTNESSQTDEK
jgi:hypothetical protein